MLYCLAMSNEFSLQGAAQENMLAITGGYLSYVSLKKAI